MFTLATPHPFCIHTPCLPPNSLQFLLWGDINSAAPPCRDKHTLSQKRSHLLTTTTLGKLALVAVETTAVWSVKATNTSLHWHEGVCPRVSTAWLTGLYITTNSCYLHVNRNKLLIKNEYLYNTIHLLTTTVIFYHNIMQSEPMRAFGAGLKLLRRSHEQNHVERFWTLNQSYQHWWVHLRLSLEYFNSEVLLHDHKY